MDALPDNAIRPFVARRGKLIPSFDGFSDDQLRACLGQLIDGLERLDELSGGVGFVSDSWRRGKLNDKDWKREVSRTLHTTPLVVFDPGKEPWHRSQWQDTSGKDCEVRNMTREDLEQGIRQAWEFSRRFAKMFNAGARAARQVMAGEYLQAESDKPEPEVPPTPSRRSLRP